MISLFLPSNGGNAFPTSYNATTAPTIDGFDLRGGDQNGFPGNINDITGLPTGLPPSVVTQGGAIFANAYARNLQITNNVVQNNGGAYGDDPARHARPGRRPTRTSTTTTSGSRNNRIIANGGTNLAGGIGIFAGADNYEVAGNDICGNFSAEYGGGICVYGLQPERHDPPQPDLLQRVVRRGRRDHDRRPAAGRLRRPLAGRRPGRRSTPTSSRRTSPTTTAAASGS